MAVNVIAPASYFFGDAALNSSRREPDLVVDGHNRHGILDFTSERNVPWEVLALTSTGGQHLLEATVAYNDEFRRVARGLVQDLQPGLKHHSIHCLSFGYSLQSLCGFTLTEFSQVFAALVPALIKQFPRSPLLVEDQSAYQENPRLPSTIRFKLMVTLVRLKHLLSFPTLETQFGWSHSQIEQWVKLIIPIIITTFAKFRCFPSHAAQKLMAWKHRQRCIARGTWDQWVRRYRASDSS